MKTLTNFQRQIALMYLDYVNNFLTLERFAEHYSINEPLAREIINQGRELVNN